MTAIDFANLQMTLDNVDDRIYSFNRDLKLFVANAPMADDYKKAFGVDFKPGVFVLEGVPEPIYSTWMERYKRVLDGEEFELVDQFFIEDIPEYIKISFKPILEQGVVIGGTCHSRDITRQFKAEQKIQENEFHLSAQINNTNESIWSVDRDCRILTINHVFQNDFEQVFKHKLQKGDRVLDFLPPDLAAEWKNRYDKALKGDHFTKTDRFEFGDFLKFSEVSFNPIWVNGEVVGVAGFTKDITDLVLKQKELQQALGKAEESDRLKSAFVANISHEIRSPLNSILGFAELGFDDDFSAEEKNSFYENMMKSGAHLMDVIDGIIDISIIEAGQLDLKKTRFEVNELLSECISLVKGARNNQLVTLRFDRKPENWLISDEKRVRQVVVNLLTNAYKFTERGGITIGFEDLGQELKFYVKDTGTGIDESIGDHLFDRFYRAVGNKEIATGTGLGLAISRALVEALNGSIWYESTLGKGSTFYFTLPKE